MSGRVADAIVLHVHQHATLGRIVCLHGRRGFVALLRLRAIPLIPSLLLDYSAGTARMEFIAYVGATMLGSFTSTAIFVFLASHLAAGLTTGAAHEALLWSLGAGAVLVTMSFVPRLLRHMRRT